jgi:hypothetical protein
MILALFFGLPSKCLGLIKTTHAYHIKTSNGKVKGKKNDTANRAKTLVSNTKQKKLHSA